MEKFSSKFYFSQAWKDCRNGYLKSVGGLCERCLKRGIYKPAEIIHHKVFLTPSNIDDPTITLNWGNLTALCRDCHAEVHGRQRRYTVNPDGSIAPVTE